MKGIKVIIAEDEPIVARYIRGIVQSIPDFYVMAMCDNGEEALNAYKREEAQVLITDIRMPGIDGLELIRQLKSNGFHPQIIIISGYKDFEYAKQAISLGVECYITKPIDLEEIKQSLNKIRIECMEEIVLESKQCLEKSLYNMDSNYFNKIFQFEHCSLLAVYLSVEQEKPHIPLWSENFIYFRYRSALFILNGISEGYSYDSCVKKMQEIARKISFSKSRKRTCTTFLIKEIDVKEDCLRMFRKVNQILMDHVIPGRLVVREYDDLKEIKSRKHYTDEDLLKKIDMRISAKEWSKICLLLESLFDLWKESETSLHRIKSKLLSIIDKMQKSGMLQENQAVVNEYVEDSIKYSDSYEEIKESVCGLFGEFMKKNGNQLKSSEALYVEIRNFVLQNMEKNYSLNEISDIFGVSQPYIRKIFHTYVGTSYNEWILKTKIEFAKELMNANPNLMIKEIAERIGYEQLYFSTVFNRYEGMSPSKYRGMRE